MKSFFLSHSHADSKFARQLARDLRVHDVYIWIDEAEIKVGDSLLGKIAEGIDRVDYVGVVLSSTSVKSKWVQKETEIAMNHEIEGRRVKVLPILIEDCDVPSFLLDKLYADFRYSYSQGLKSLLSRLEAKDFLGPHQPNIRSHEISISAKSVDQIPQIIRSGANLFVQWVEHREELDIVYIYVLDIVRFEFIDCFFYTLQTEIFHSWLMASSSRIASFVHLLDEEELWFVDLSEPTKLKPVKIDWSARFIESIIPISDGFAASSSSPKAIEVIEISLDGVLRRKTSQQVSYWPSNIALVQLPNGIGMFSITLRGIEFSTIDSAFSIQSPMIIIASEGRHSIPADLDLHFYDNCTYSNDGTILLLYQHTKEGGQDLIVCALSPNGEVLKTTTLLSNLDQRLHIFKPSFGIGQHSMLVLWNVGQRISRPEYLVDVDQKMLLSCMLFDRTTLKPLLPYDRTLTTGSNCSSGVPVVVNKDTYYVVYEEDTFEQFKIKVSEIKLNELPK